jgi:chromosome partitioning protein
MSRIAIASQKGGVGKTTTSLQLAHFISEKLNKSVLIIDMDMQGNTSSQICTEKNPDGSDNFGEGTTTAYDLFDPDLKEIKPYQRPGTNISLIHTVRNCPELASIEKHDLSVVTTPQLNLAKIADQFDFVIIDCPPSLGQALIAGLIMSTAVICPVKLSGFALTGLEGLLRTIIGVQSDYNPDMTIAGILVNDMDTKSVSHKRALAELNEGLGDLVLENKIMHRPPLDTATNDGMPVWSYPYAHVAAREVEAACTEIIEKSQ